MSDLAEMIKRYSIKYDQKIKNICAPLKTLGISGFYYFKTEANGGYFNITNQAESACFFYEKKLYIEEAYSSHPSLLKSGVILASDPNHCSYIKPMFLAFKMHHGLVFVHVSEAVEVFAFALMGSDQPDTRIFFDNFDLLSKFTRYFKREAKDLIGRLEAEGFNIKKAKGDAFFKVDSSEPLCNVDPNVDKFLKLILPLSRRERQCLELFKQGNSSQTTGAILGISQRTVESYFDHIKNKLGCRSKSELLEW